MHLSLKCALAMLALAPAAHAQVTLTFLQSGSDVNAQATGTLNLTGLTKGGSGSNQMDFVEGQNAAVVVGSSGASFDIYSGFTGPAAFGSGGAVTASSGSGSRFAIADAQDLLLVPGGYTSGSPISGGAVFTGQSFSSLGLTPGTYTYKLPNDTVTVNIGAPVPEASTTVSFGLLLALGMGGLVIAARRKKVSA